MSQLLLLCASRPSSTCSRDPPLPLQFQPYFMIHLISYATPPLPRSPPRTQTQSPICSDVLLADRRYRPTWGAHTNINTNINAASAIVSPVRPSDVCLPEHPHRQKGPRRERIGYRGAGCSTFRSRSFLYVHEALKCRPSSIILSVKKDAEYHRSVYGRLLSIIADCRFAEIVGVMSHCGHTYGHGCRCMLIGKRAVRCRL